MAKMKAFFLLDKMGYAEEAAERKQQFEKIAGKDYRRFSRKPTVLTVG